MARLVKLFDERQLLVSMQADTLILISDCRSIEPIKKFVECYDILKLTWDIQEKYPRQWPEDPECDEHALLYLKLLTQHLFACHLSELPRPGFDVFTVNVQKLLQVFRVPRGGYGIAKLEDGTEIPKEADLPGLCLLDGGTRGRDPET